MNFLRKRCLALCLAVLLIEWLAPANASESESFRRGLKEARAGRMDRAIRHWSRTLLKDPRSYAAHVNRGTAYLWTGYVLKGITDWHQAKKLSPVFALGVYNPNFIDELPGDRRILNFAKPLEIDPDFVPSVAMMGIAYLDVGRPDLAAELYRKSIDLTRNPMLKNTFDYWIQSIEGTQTD